MPGITLGYADGIRLCDKHWDKYCEIELPDKDKYTHRELLAFERKMLKFTAKCGSATSRKKLREMERDPANYEFQHVSLRNMVDESSPPAPAPSEPEAAEELDDDFLAGLGEDTGSELAI